LGLKAHRIKAVRFISLLNIEYPDPETNPTTNIGRLLSSGAFYYSRDMDLTLCLQKRGNIPDSSFVWNHYMLSHFHSENELPDLMVRVIHGFVAETHSPLGKLAVISRLGAKRAGTRFLARGVDDDGNVSNFVEVTMAM
jgi:hypothetical protein